MSPRDAPVRKGSSKRRGTWETQPVFTVDVTEAPCYNSCTYSLSSVLLPYLSAACIRPDHLSLLLHLFEKMTSFFVLLVHTAASRRRRKACEGVGRIEQKQFGCPSVGIDGTPAVLDSRRGFRFLGCMPAWICVFPSGSSNRGIWATWKTSFPSGMGSS